MKTALITGASRGLGYATALELAPDYHIIALARTVGGLEDLATAIEAKGGSSTLVPLDLTDTQALPNLAASIKEKFTTLDLWIHTAVNAPPMAPAALIASSDYTKTMATNVTALANLIATLSPILKGQAVITTAPEIGAKFQGAYGASKAAAQALTQSWAAETAQTGPKVSLFTPEPMATATRARFHPGEDQSKLASPASQAKRLIVTL